MESKAVGQEEETEVIMTGESAAEAYENLMKSVENAKEVTTNFDRITESPERLAKVLAMKALRPCGYELPCNVDCPLNKRCMEDNEPPPTDYEVWLIWLEMESKE